MNSPAKSREPAGGHRTFGGPGDLCGTCSDPERDRWVLAQDCPYVLEAFDVLVRAIRNDLEGRQ